jgi:hypothetical protein
LSLAGALGRGIKRCAASYPPEKLTSSVQQASSSDKIYHLRCFPLLAYDFATGFWDGLAKMAGN